jgi:hypothetical protein
MVGTSGKMEREQWENGGAPVAKYYGTIGKRVGHQWENGKEPMGKWWGPWVK